MFFYRIKVSTFRHTEHIYRVLSLLEPTPVSSLSERMGAYMSIEPEMAAEVPAVVPRRYKVTLPEEDVSPAEMAVRRGLADILARGFVEKLFYRGMLLINCTFKLEKVKTLDGLLHEERIVREIHDNFASDYNLFLDATSECSEVMMERVESARVCYLELFGRIMDQCYRAELAFKYGFTPEWVFHRARPV
jgi:hypothetical protein